MNKNSFAVTPPMGWNSYDYYDTTVNEEQVKANADYMAAHLKEYGWDYVVVDIQWYAWGAGSMRDKHQYIPFSRLEMDEYGRLLPCPERFPSAKDGAGFQAACGLRSFPWPEIRHPHHARYSPRGGAEPSAHSGKRADGGRGGGSLFHLRLESGHVRPSRERGGKPGLL